MAENKQQLEKKNLGGRPKVQLDEKLLEDLASIHCTKEEIAKIMGCSVDTLYARYSEVLFKGSAIAKSSLRRLQWEQAKRGNTMMLIWLGKQWLGQRDRHPDEAPQTLINVVIKEVP